MTITLLLYVLIQLRYSFFLLPVGTGGLLCPYAASPGPELYPVPHEAAARAEHGGVHFEVTAGGRSLAHSNLVGELKFMLPEMLFQKALWEFNRHFGSSRPIPFGLYLLIGSTGLLGVRAMLHRGRRPISGETGLVLHDACAVGWLGGAGLRATDRPGRGRPLAAISAWRGRRRRAPHRPRARRPRG